MDYYEKRKMAGIDMDAILKRVKKIEIANLVSIMEAKYGFGDNYVRNRLARLKELGFVNVREGIVEFNTEPIIEKKKENEQ